MPWVQQWANKHLYAGVPGLGAADGWYNTSLLLELYMLKGIPFVGGAVDIMKCFD
jgi:hypothetical protein